MIKRTEIEKRMGESVQGEKNSGFSQILEELLREVVPVEYGSVRKCEVLEYALDKARTELMEGGFESAEVEGTVEFDSDLANSFFGGPVEKHFHLSLSSQVIEDPDYEGGILGIACQETARYFAFLKAANEKLADNQAMYTSHGLLVSNEHFRKLLNPEVEIEGYDYFGTYMNHDWIFYRTDKKRSHVAVTVFDMVTRLFSRNTGLLESSVMSDKTALIVGCGSVGALIALELARAGVGHFILIDGDTLEIHNICRHQLGFRDLGRYKVDAVADAIHNINPYAEVHTFRGYLQEIPPEILDGFQDGIVVGCGDNRESSAEANELAEVLKVPFVATGCWQRAHAGEIFYWAPDMDMPLYRDAFGGLISDERPASHQHYFAADEDGKKLNFEPGTATDIEFVTLVAVKVIYDLLNRDTDQYTTRVLGYLTNYTLVCNTNEPVIGGKDAEIFPHPLFISNTITAGGYKKRAG